MERPGISTTLTLSAYLSPKKASAPFPMAFVVGNVLMFEHRFGAPDLFVDLGFDGQKLLVR